MTDFNNEQIEMLNSLKKQITSFKEDLINLEKFDFETRLSLALELLDIIKNLTFGVKDEEIKLFKEAEKMNIHILRPRYNSPVPDARELSKELWTKTSDLVGINMNDEDQVNRLRQFLNKFKDECKAFPEELTEISQDYFINNGMFGYLDAIIYYCMIRNFKPKNIIEVGAGFSTLLATKAILKNQQEDNAYQCKLIAIEPYPKKLLKKGFSGLSKLIKTPVQQIPLTLFSSLKMNDILFIDSSHVLKIGSDVQFLFSEVIPRLNSGVLVHFHDIFLPLNYKESAVLERRKFFNEQYILQAFLCNNSNFKILWASQYMWIIHRKNLIESFNACKKKPGNGGSFWMKKIK